MVRQEARFHLTMLLAQYSNPVANRFETLFQHRDRVRSSNKAEMTEINEFWGSQLKQLSPKAAKLATELPVDSGIDEWLDQFSSNVLTDVLRRW